MPGPVSTIDPLKLALLEAKNPLKHFGPNQFVCFEIPTPRPHLSGLERHCQTKLRFLACGYVLYDTDDAFRFSRLVAEERSGQIYPHNGSIFLMYRFSIRVGLDCPARPCAWGWLRHTGEIGSLYHRHQQHAGQ
jgi:hypothetical protein